MEEETICSFVGCGRSLTNNFSLECSIFALWYHGHCVQMKSEMADEMDKQQLEWVCWNCCSLELSDRQETPLVISPFWMEVECLSKQYKPVEVISESDGEQSQTSESTFFQVQYPAKKSERDFFFLTSSEGKINYYLRSNPFPR